MGTAFSYRKKSDERAFPFADFMKTLRMGIAGLDTSHVGLLPTFCMNITNGQHVHGRRIP